MVGAMTHISTLAPGHYCACSFNCDPDLIFSDWLLWSIHEHEAHGRHWRCVCGQPFAQFALYLDHISTSGHYARLQFDFPTLLLVDDGSSGMLWEIRTDVEGEMKEARKNEMLRRIAAIEDSALSGGSSERLGSKQAVATNRGPILKDSTEASMVTSSPTIPKCQDPKTSSATARKSALRPLPPRPDIPKPKPISGKPKDIRQRRGLTITLSILTYSPPSPKALINKELDIGNALRGQIDQKRKLPDSPPHPHPPPKRIASHEMKLRDVEPKHHQLPKKPPPKIVRELKSYADEGERIVVPKKKFQYKGKRFG